MTRPFYLNVALSAALVGCQLTSSPRPETDRIERATAIALAAIPSSRTGDYRVVSAVESVTDGAYKWRITFKMLDLLPHNPSEQLVGLGGELFVDVDLASGATETRFGE